MKRIRSIKSGPLSRGFALAKVSFSAGARVATHAIGNIFANEEDKADRLKKLLSAQANVLAKEFGQLKGSLMKVGQLLSTYGEHFLPPEANEFLKSLQNRSPALEWKEIERVLMRQLGKEKLALLDIDPEPIASASLGQVHQASRKSGGPLLAMKIQYPGVDRAIDLDLKALRSVLNVAQLLPGNSERYDEIFKEIREMLHREVDYLREQQSTQFFREALAQDSRYIVPEVISEFSTPRVMTTTFQEGYSVDGPEVAALSQEERNQLGIAVLELYFRELFELGVVQTDPHFGNYRVKVVSGAAPSIVLLDFGATRKLSRSFLDSYQAMVRGAFLRDGDQVKKAALELGFLEPQDPLDLQDEFVELCELIMEPFSGDSYDWGVSDLPKRVARKGSRIILNFRLRLPPREIVFLDRKMGGIFIFLAVLKVKINGREILAKFLG